MLLGASELKKASSDSFYIMCVDAFITPFLPPREEVAVTPNRPWMHHYSKVLAVPHHEGIKVNTAFGFL